MGLVWVQEKEIKKQLTFKKVKGDDNPSDLMTEYLNAIKILEHMKILNQIEAKGRSKVSLQVRPAHTIA